MLNLWNATECSRYGIGFTSMYYTEDHGSFHLLLYIVPCAQRRHKKEQLTCMNQNTFYLIMVNREENATRHSQSTCKALMGPATWVYHTQRPLHASSQAL